MNSEIVLKSDVAKSLLPTGYKGNINLNDLATQVKKANDQGNRSLEKLKEMTSGSFIGQLWNGKDINVCMRDSLDAISTLSRSQLILQAMTADLNEEILYEQKIIEKQQHQLSSQQSTLAGHSKKIEELVQKTDQTDLIGEIVSEQEAIREQLTNLDLEKIKSLQHEQEEIIRSLHDALSQWVEKSTLLIAEVKLDINNRYANIEFAISLAINDAISRDNAIEDHLSKVAENTREDISGLINRTQELSSGIQMVESRTDNRYQELHHAAKIMSADFWSMNGQHQFQQRKVKQLVISMIVLSLTEFGLIAYLFFR